MAMEVEFVHNRKVSEVLTALGNKMEMEKRQSVGVAPDHV
jgi:hypothetical protein